MENCSDFPFRNRIYFAGGSSLWSYQEQQPT
jgi:hypothetical protein